MTEQDLKLWTEEDVTAAVNDIIDRDVLGVEDILDELLEASDDPRQTIGGYKSSGAMLGAVHRRFGEHAVISKRASALVERHDDTTDVAALAEPIASFVGQVVDGVKAVKDGGGD